MVSDMKFLENQVRIGASEPKAIDCCPAGIARDIVGPGMRRRGDRKLGIGQVDLRTRRHIVVLPANHSLLKRLAYLDQRASAGGPAGISNQCLRTYQSNSG